jgi:hypothetical protein
MRKLVFATALLLLASTAFTWPSIPKAIAIGQGIYIKNGVKTPFLWGVMQSLARKENIYVLISTSITEYDRSELDSKLEVILHDEESTILRVRINTSDKQSREITKTVTEKIASICPKIHFDLDSASYGSRL